MVGLTGYPNVGKSSTINALFGSKKTAVAATPGKTKHFQTLNITERMTLCDCPGLVLPKFAASKAEMVAAGERPHCMAVCCRHRPHHFRASLLLTDSFCPEKACWCRGDVVLLNTLDLLLAVLGHPVCGIESSEGVWCSAARRDPNRPAHRCARSHRGHLPENIQAAA